MNAELDTAREIVELALAELRRVGAVRRYRAGAGDGAARAVARLHGAHGSDRGEVRLEVTPLGADAEVSVRWTSPLGGRWWAEAVDLKGAAADPYEADWALLDAVLADVRRWAAGAIRPAQLTAAYTRPKIKPTVERAWERGMVWA